MQVISCRRVILKCMMSDVCLALNACLEMGTFTIVLGMNAFFFALNCPDEFVSVGKVRGVDLSAAKHVVTSLEDFYIFRETQHDFNFQCMFCKASERGKNMN